MNSDKDQDLDEFCAGIDARHNNVDIGYSEFTDAIDGVNDLTKPEGGITEVVFAKKKESAINAKLWNACARWVKSKFPKSTSKKREILTKKRYMNKGGKFKKLNEASNSGGITTGNNPTGKATSTVKTTTTTTVKQASTAKDSTIPGGDTNAYDFAKYKNDNKKYGNSHLSSKQPKNLSFDRENKSQISLKEIVDDILSGKK